MNKLVIFVCLLLATTCQAKFNLHALLQKFESDLTKALDAKDGIKFKDCGSTTGEITSVSVTDCTDVPCIFQKGSNYTLTLNFNSKVNTKSISNQVYGVIAKIPVPFHLPNADGCALGISCPVKTGDSLTESVTLPILPEYPSLSLYVKWEAIDDQNKQLACFLFPVKIK